MNLPKVRSAYVSLRTVTLLLGAGLLLFILFVGIEEEYQSRKTLRENIERQVKLETLQLQNYFRLHFDKLQLIFNRTNELDLRKLRQAQEYFDTMEKPLEPLVGRLNRDVIFGSYDLYLVDRNRTIRRASLPMDVGMDFHGNAFAMKIFDMVERGVIPVHISQPFYQAPTRDFRRYLLTLSKDKSFFIQISHNYFPIESIGREIRKIREKTPHLLDLEVLLLANDAIIPFDAPWREKKEYFERFRRLKEKFVRKMISELHLEIAPKTLLEEPQALLKYFQSHPLLYRIDSEKKEAVTYSASENLFNDTLNQELILLRIRYDLSPLFETYRKEHNRLLLILLVSTLVALALIFTVHFLYLHPVRKIVKALANDREVDLGRIRIREFRQLSDAINSYRRNLYRRHEELEKLTFIDPLTGAYNRRYFEKSLEEKIRQAKTEQESFALVIFDLDNFKKINDRYGHDVGDEILKNLAHLVRGILREEDLFFRIGGEEFALLLSPAIRIDEIRSIVEQLRRSVETTLPAEGMPVTISMGVALYHEGDDVVSLFRKADHAMYHSKERGKNRVTFA